MPNQTPGITLVLVDIYIFLYHEKELTPAYGEKPPRNHEPAHPADQHSFFAPDGLFQPGQDAWSELGLV